MAIKRIKVSNFKSFKELEIDLRPLNIVIGANAAGKSNFLEIFRFLRDIGEYGLENAISLQGGMEYLASLRIGAVNPVSLEITGSAGGEMALKVERVSRPPGFTAKSDEEFFGELGKAFLKEISVFDFDPKLPKRATPIAGKAQLESDGRNLASVLKAILQTEDRTRQLQLLLLDLLPFVSDLKVDRLADRSLLISLKERFGQNNYLPASFLSDGTIHLIALIVALYFEKSSVAIIEEPERNIHPYLVSKVAAMLVDASEGKQVIVTTHNPELVKHACLDDLLLVYRDKEGFSCASRPADNEELKIFLENDLGVDDLYVQNLLGVGK